MGYPAWFEKHFAEHTFHDSMWASITGAANYSRFSVLAHPGFANSFAKNGSLGPLSKAAAGDSKNSQSSFVFVQRLQMQKTFFWRDWIIDYILLWMFIIWYWLINHLMDYKCLFILPPERIPFCDGSKLCQVVAANTPAWLSATRRRRHCRNLRQGPAVRPTSWWNWFRSCWGPVFLNISPAWLVELGLISSGDLPLTRHQRLDQFFGSDWSTMLVPSQGLPLRKFPDGFKHTRLGRLPMVADWFRFPSQESLPVPHRWWVYNHCVTNPLRPWGAETHAVGADFCVAVAFTWGHR